MNQYTTTSDSVGDWDGEEDLAASQFDVIANEIIRLVGNGVNSDDLINDAIHWAWDHVGSDVNLLTMSDAELRAIAAKYV